MRPLMIDLYCGLGGWTEGGLAAGFDVVGYDIERHVYGEHRYPAQLVLQDVRTLHGSQFKDASLIVASSPCQEFSYRAMPWKRAKALGPPLLGMELFAQAARIQREACEASGRYIPMIQENVCGAQRWVGRAQWHYGSYYLWGDIPALMPTTTPKAKVPGQDWNRLNATGEVSRFNAESERETKNGGGSWFSQGARVGKVTRNDPRDSAVKVPSESGRRTDVGKGARFTSRDCGDEGVKQRGSGAAWFDTGIAAHGSKSSARKAASARIAKIPFLLAEHIARVYYPQSSECAS